MVDEKLARALRSRARREMLKLMTHKKEVSVHEVALCLNMSESVASRHLKMLFDFGMIGFVSRPPEKFYFLKISSMKGLLDAYNSVVTEMKRDMSS